MATHMLHQDDERLYFVMFTCYKWLPLFKLTNSYDEVYKWFGHIETKGAKIVGFVIMTNHVHCLVYLTKGGENLNRLVGNGKRFMAYEIVKRLKGLGMRDILTILIAGVQVNEHKKGHKHKVFRLSFDAKICYGDEMVERILEYMHHNPVSGRWNLVNDYVEYVHSSAGFYELGERHNYCNILHYRD